MKFPLASRPKPSYKTGGRKFGAPRGKPRGSRKHAGCDLIVPEGTEIYAVDQGVITRGPYPFTTNVFAVEVKHSSFTVRYGEISGLAKGLKRGSTIKEGQLIAYVGKMKKESMLHFEMYSGKAVGPLSQKNNPPYMRRKDLIDPTPYLDKWPLP